MFIPASETSHLFLLMAKTLSLPWKLPLPPSGLVSLSHRGLLHSPRLSWIHITSQHTKSSLQSSYHNKQLCIYCCYICCISRTYHIALERVGIEKKSIEWIIPILSNSKGCGKHNWNNTCKSIPKFNLALININSSFPQQVDYKLYTTFFSKK